MTKLDSRIYKATLRDKDNRTLSAGGVRIYKDELRGVFLPQGEADAVSLPKLASSVLADNDIAIQICKLRYRNKEFPSGDFEFQILPEQDSALANLGMPKF